MSDLGNSGRQLERSEIASLYNVTVSTVDGWVARGCPQIDGGSKIGPAQFDVAAVFRWRIGRAVADALMALDGDAAGMTREEAEGRKALAEARLAELDRHERAGRIMARADLPKLRRILDPFNAIMLPVG
ncbi:terminase small subunit [Methylobacterium sp. J-030]|uniref:terminase small subunit n=1 Tax=Methylobacterium sp. J-030 TaxID=2836627 RepID=UPI001FBB0D88|nr:terminase small subunit [Methylobacterium sp. J-030]MCJ2068306.1 terminase small subunit [Methylobacterium sp. J-030]